MKCRTKSDGVECDGEAKWFVVADWIKRHPTCDRCRVGWAKFPEARFYPVAQGTKTKGWLPPPNS